MEAALLLVTIIAIVLLIHWVTVNDASGNKGPTKGFFAMPDPPEQKKQNPGDRRD